MNYKDKLKSYGLKITDKGYVSVDTLHVRYLPHIFNVNIWRGEKPMWLPNSPHVELMQIFKKVGWNRKFIENSRYFLDRRYRNSVGMNWPDERIWEHIRKNRYKTFKSIKKHGYKKSLCKDVPIVILKEPIWKTRYVGEEMWLSGREIHNGAGRCAAAYVLGIKKLPCVFVKDKRPGTKKSFLDRKIKEMKNANNIIGPKSE